MEGCFGDSQIACDVLIVRFSGEVGVKSPYVRAMYERAVQDHVEKVLAYYQIPYDGVLHTVGRTYVLTVSTDEALTRLTKVFGVSSMSPAVKTTSKLEDIVDVCVKTAASAFQKESSFAVKCRRVGKHQYGSMEVCERVGEAVLRTLSHKRLSVNLSKPDYVMSVEVRDKDAYVFLHTYMGAGGYPVGSQGKMVCLISPDICSPVASWLTMKRGCPIVSLYFDNAPYGDAGKRESVFNVVKILLDWAIGYNHRKIYVIPYGENIKKIVGEAPENIVGVLCKRVRYRVAEIIADRERADGIVTGEIVNEEGDQTLHAIHVANTVLTGRPVHRPLIGFTENEVEELARRIGTYEVTSRGRGCTVGYRTQPTVFNLQEILEAEKELDVEEMVRTSVSQLRVYDIITGGNIKNP